MTDSVEVTIEMYDEYIVIADTYTIVSVDVDMDDDLTLEID